MEAVHIQGEGNCNGQEKILRHMGQLSRYTVNSGSIVGNLIVVQSYIKQIVCRLYKNTAGLVADRGGEIPLLGGK